MIGQQHLLGEGMAPLAAFESGTAAQMILWACPGGQDHHGAADGDAFDAQFITISAYSQRRQGHPRGGRACDGAGTALEGASGLAGGAPSCFVDEVHRFNKSQQDASRRMWKSGLFTFIGATTENPSFEVNPALLRARVTCCSR